MIVETFKTDMHGRQVIAKEQPDVLDYFCDLAPYLAKHNTTLISATATVGPDATMTQKTIGGSLWEAWIGGGTPGKFIDIALRVISVGTDGINRDDTMHAYINII
jgi:hypothetical protein